MTDQKIEDETRRQISIFLPDAIARALTSYFEFSKSKATEQECKTFAAHHSASKAAISHLELLIKLAKWADLPDASADNHNQQILLAAMMQEAQAEVDGYNEAETGAD